MTFETLQMIRLLCETVRREKRSQEDFCKTNKYFELANEHHNVAEICTRILKEVSQERTTGCASFIKQGA